MAKRRYLEITEMVSGLIFRFYFDRQYPDQLHLVRRWGVAPEVAISVYYDSSAMVVWQSQHKRFETRARNYILAWLQLDSSRVLVLSCLPRSSSRAEED